MLDLHKISPDHRSVFAERYERLRLWALQITSGDHMLAEDLLHDAFLLFTLNHPDLARIENLEGYLYTMLRNLHLSQLRQTTRHRFQQLSIIEYESAATGLRNTARQRDQIQVQEELRRVCNYACVRKETANAASVLILRFFHGYYPSEIAKILRSTRRAVDDRLRLARSEAKANLENPQALKFLSHTAEIKIPEPFPTNFARAAGDFLLELRELIFRSRQGECLSSEQLKDLYQSNGAMESKRLAHIVSCAICLDATNKLLGLPLLDERYPTDTIGKDTDTRSGSGGGGSGNDRSGSGARRAMNRWERDVGEAFEHKPQELCVAVNGYLLSSQKINSELSELTLSLKGEERISFFEIFSEQGIRLMMMCVDELPPEGPGEQGLCVELSDARTLASRLRFSSPWPTLHVTYHDPELKAESATYAENLQANAQPSSLTEAESSPRKFNKISEYLSPFVKALRKRIANPHLFLQPGAATALFAIILIAALLLMYLRLPAPVVSASELLRRSSVAEESIAAKPEEVLHRTLDLEEREGNGGQALAHRRIEVWQSAARGIKALRLYDERNNLVAGEWTREDNSRTLYRRDAPPQTESAFETQAIVEPLGIENVWKVEPSSKDFIALIGHAEGARVEEQPSAYVVTYESASPAPTSGLVKATLVIRKTDLHVTHQSLLVKRGDEAREYRFVEASFERHPASGVAPGIFEPEAELLGTPSRTIPTRGATNDSMPAPRPSTTAIPPPAVAVASAELEVEVLQHLNRTNALFGEQISLTRTPEGQLLVTGIIETDRRKMEIMDALAIFKQNPAVHIEIETVAEAAQRQARVPAATNPAIASTVEVEAKSVTPTDQDLRRYFADHRRLSGEALDSEIRSYGDNQMAHSRQARRHALALKQIVERFSADALRAMDESARQKWRAMIEQHARSLGEETATLRRELQPIFPPPVSASDVNIGINITRDADLARAVRQLYEMAAANDESTRRSFSISSVGGGEVLVKTVQFWRSLLVAEQIATLIQQAASASQR